MSKKIVIVIQARMSSSRLPAKVMLPILGESLLFRMIERIKQVKYKVEIVVATSERSDDNVIVLEAVKANVVWYRGSLSNLLDRHYQVGRLTGADVVVKIPSDCPLIDPAVIDRVLDYYFQHEEDLDFVSNLHPATYPDGNDVELMTMECLSKTWHEANRPLELEHTTPYIWENPDKFSIANVYWETGLDYSMSHRFTMDYREDYDFIKRIFEELYPKKRHFDLTDILNLLDKKRSIYNINAKYAGVNWYRNHLSELKTVGVNQTKSMV
jgi:spore coat polysaccharide biosynthesis protein SpsF